MEPVNELPDRLSQLMTWITDGWRVEEPILQRSMLHCRTGSICAFEVVVRRDDERRVIALMDDHAVQLWLEQANFHVLHI
ncbi:MAG: hypothetical protein H0X37_08795 [Herpetosiphonaceae bacterium]|nr:hypothetical protein [Herpetosiphonaceae bacterium]